MSEKRAVIDVTIKTQIESYDSKIVKAVEEGNDNTYTLIHALAQDIIDCCGIAGRGMVIDDIEYRIDK